jgi:hypothetical protein
MVIPGKCGARSGSQRTPHICPDFGCGDEIATGGGVRSGSNHLLKANWQVLEGEFRVAVQPPQGHFALCKPTSGEEFSFG